MTGVRPSPWVLWACLLASSVATASPDPYEAARAKPLFSPSRRPPPEAPATTAAVLTPPPRPPAPPPNVAVSGIILGQGAEMALLRRPADATATRVIVGSRVDGWTVAEIRPRAVVLRLNERSVTVALPEPKP